MTETEQEDSLEVDIYKEKVKVYVSGLSHLSRNIEKVYGIVWGQCSSALQAKIKSVSGYHEKSSTLDCLWLLQELKKATSGINAKADPVDTIIDAYYIIFRMRKGPTEANDSYMERFRANIDTVELAQGQNVF